MKGIMDYNADELRHIALKLIEKGRYEDAKKCYDKALELEPENPGLIKMAAINLRHMKKYKEAMKLLEKCLALYSEKRHIWREMATAYMKKWQKTIIEKMLTS